MFPSIDVTKLKNKPKFELCRPYPMRNKISNLIDLDNIQLKMNLGKVHELSFDMSYYVDIDHQLVKNPLIDKFEGKYQVKMTWNDITEYFVYSKGNRKLDNNGNTITYKLYSYPSSLQGKLIRGYEEVSQSLSYHANEILAETNWTLDFVDVEFDLKKRTIEISEANVLQSLYDLATKYNALIMFDSVNLKVSFHQPQNIGLNKGMTFKPSTFIESLGYEIDYDQIVTRLNVYGSEGLEFRRLSPTGSNFVESLDWFIYPFEQDSNGQVIKHSKWLTDDLCIAYKNYQLKISQLTPTFKTLSTNYTDKEDEIIQAKQELSVLETERRQIEEVLWVINKTYMDNAPNRSDWKNAVNQKNTKLAQITTKNNFITDLENQLESIGLQIVNLREQVKVENNFNQLQIEQMNEFIIQRTHTNDSIVDEQELLDEGIEVFKEVGQPPITISLKIANFLNDIDYFLVHNRIALGDTIKIKSEEIDVFVELKILEINYNISNDDISLTISNMKDLRDDYAKLVDKIYDASTTSTTVNMDKFKWDKVEGVETNVDKILNSGWDASKNALFGGHKDTTILDEWGLKSYDSSDKNTFLFINNGVFGITKDSGNTIEVAITKDGIFANRLTGKILIGEKVVIEDSNGVWETRGSTTVVYDQTHTPSMWIGQLEANCFGIRMDNRKHRINLSTCDGFKISKYRAGGSLEDVLIADLDGNFWTKYFTHEVTKIKDDENYFELDNNEIAIKDPYGEMMKMGKIPSGYFNNCYIPLDWGIVLKGKNNSNIFMTANRGFAIDVNCQTKFQVLHNGNLYAQDIEANDMKIKSATIGSGITINESNGIQVGSSININANKGITIDGFNGVTLNSSRGTVKMNAYDGFKINNGSEDLLYVGMDGKLYLQNIFTLDENGDTVTDLDGSYISDLTVNRLKTLSQTNRTNYVHIEDRYIKFNTEGMTKLEIAFYDTLAYAYPMITWGYGDGTNRNKVYQYKTDNQMALEYVGGDGYTRGMYLNNTYSDGVSLVSPNTVSIEVHGVKYEFTAYGIIANGQLIAPLH